MYLAILSPGCMREAKWQEEMLLPSIAAAYGQPQRSALAESPVRTLPRKSPGSSVLTAPLVPLSSAGESPIRRALPFRMPARERVVALQGGFPRETRPQARPRGKLHLRNRIQAAVHAVLQGLVEHSPRRQPCI